MLAYILEERDGSGKSALDWINLSRLAAAHFALTEAGYSYKDAANRLIKSAPKIIDLLKVTQRAKSFGAQERLIQLRKNFQNNRATKIQAAKDAFQYALMAINKHKSDPEKLVQLAAALILAVDPLQRPLF